MKPIERLVDTVIEKWELHPIVYLGDYYNTRRNFNTHSMMAMILQSGFRSYKEIEEYVEMFVDYNLS